MAQLRNYHERRTTNVFFQKKKKKKKRPKLARVDLPKSYIYLPKPPLGAYFL